MNDISLPGSNSTVIKLIWIWLEEIQKGELCHVPLQVYKSHEQGQEKIVWIPKKVWKGETEKLHSNFSLELKVPMYIGHKGNENLCQPNLSLWAHFYITFNKGLSDI